MSKVMPVTSVLAAAMLAAAPGALAQVTSSPQPARSPWPDVGRDTIAATGTTPGTTTVFVDSAYVRQAIHGNVTEVVLGRLAESRAADSAVEEFGERMISEHSSMNRPWAALARNNRIEVDADVDPAVEQSIERLEDLSGAAFDQAYMAEMIRQHEQHLAAFQRMEASARSPEVRQLADQGIPGIREHLTLAQQVASRVGVARTAGRVGDVPVPAPADDNRRRAEADRARGEERDDRNERGTLRSEDRAFVQNVLQDHLMHLRLAQRAQRQANSDATRRLAERISEDFEDWQERWEKLADRYDVKAPSHLGRLHGQKVEKLERASERNFDRSYAVIVSEHLASVVPYFQKEGQEVRSAAVRRLVEDELPVIREHLARARRLREQADERPQASDRE